MPGYSGTPLHKKLGLKPYTSLLVINEPNQYREWLGDIPDGVTFTASAEPPIAAVHLFTAERIELETRLRELRGSLEQAGFIWVSWPKKVSGVPTDITEDVIREIALPMGYVDIKVCAVSEIWSGLKLVIRKSERTKP